MKLYLKPQAFIQHQYLYFMCKPSFHFTDPMSVTMLNVNFYSVVTEKMVEQEVPLSSCHLHLSGCSGIFCHLALLQLTCHIR